MSPTLILPPRYLSDSVALWRAALASGWRAERLLGWIPPPHWRDQDPVLYGDPLWAGVVAEGLSVALLEPALDWLVDLPTRYRKRDVRLATLDQARTLITAPAFVKPADNKDFPARVYASEHDLPPLDTLPGAMHVLIAEPVRWQIEFRCFVLDRQITTLSPYFRDGQLVQTDEDLWPATEDETVEALAFGNAVLGDVNVEAPPAFVLDVGVVTGKGWAVVEANPAWASGIYGCDPERVLPVLHRACVQQQNLVDEDRRWIVDHTQETVENA